MSGIHSHPSSAGHSPRRIAVAGTSGAGKTTLARRLAHRLAIPHVELDALHWEPGWTPAEADVFRARADCALAGESWVVDGNYSVLRDLTWSRADTLVWLDYSFPIVMGRLLCRTIRRAITREELWNDNRESWRLSFFSRDSLLWWVITTYRRRRRTLPAQFQLPEYAHLHVVRLRSPRETERWEAGLCASPAIREPGCALADSVAEPQARRSAPALAEEEQA